MRHSFDDEHERAKHTYSSLQTNAEGRAPLTSLASGYSGILLQTDQVLAEEVLNDQKSIEIGLKKEHLQEAMRQKRVQTRCTIQSMDDEGPNSDLLPTMGYKRAVDYDSGLTRKSSEPNTNPPPTNLPPSGEAPPSP